MRWTAVAILIAEIRTAAVAECDYERAVWADNTGPDRIIVFIVEGGGKVGQWSGAVVAP